MDTLETIDDFAVRELDDELVILNIKIDKKIEKGLVYIKESEEHKRVVQLRIQIIQGI